MTRKSALISLTRLSLESDAELKDMVADLCGASVTSHADGAKAVRWNKRYFASGKTKDVAPPIRMS